MPAPYPASEFGGKVGNNTLQPSTEEGAPAADKLRAVYLTGTEDPQADRDGGYAWEGTTPPADA